LRLREDKPLDDTRPSPVVEPPEGSAPAAILGGAEGRPGDAGVHATVEQIVDQLHEAGERMVIEVAGHEVAFSSLDRVLWPAHGQQRALTKRDLCIYLASVALYLLPHLQDRPLTLVRFPGGIHGEHFYQRHPEHPPPFLETVRVPNGRQANAEYLLCNNLAHAALARPDGQPRAAHLVLA